MAIIETVSKCFAALSYLLIAVASIIFISVGGSILVFCLQHKHALTETNISFPGYIILGTGILLLFAGAIGLFACIKHNRCLLVLFYTMMLIILLCELALLIVSMYYWPKVSEQIAHMLHEELNMYDKVDEIQNAVDILQSKFHCCGVNKCSDWESTSFYRTNLTFPKSCCADYNSTYLYPDQKCDPYQIGCLDSLRSEVHRYLGYVIGSACTFFLLQLMGLHSTCIIICRSQTIHHWRNDGYINI
ncbi:unnamed protein product [Heterobilharzia americana]|nr:unnamed protein product [Heterobilharzia americana]